MNRNYFERYCGEGHYDDLFLAYSRVDHCVARFDRWRIPIRSVMVLGAATGRVLEFFDESWNLRPYGCEISRWAHARIPYRYRRRIERRDMRTYVPDMLRRRRRVDLIFSNSLIYIPENDVVPLLAGTARLCTWFHFWSTTTENQEAEDPYRVLLRPHAWWRTRFKEAGFRPTRSPYVWRARPAAARAVGRRL